MNDPLAWTASTELRPCGYKGRTFALIGAGIVICLLAMLLMPCNVRSVLTACKHDSNKNSYRQAAILWSRNISTLV